MTEPVAKLVITDKTVGLPVGLTPDATYDVLLNDRHVWSLQPAADTTAERKLLVATWPEALAERFLRGHADVVVREHLSQRMVARGHHVFHDDDEAIVTVADHDGAPLVLDKYGRLIRPLAADRRRIREELMDKVEGLLRSLTETAGVPGFICYGTLLGAVRNGKLIGHDNDVDIAYASGYEYPVDVIREAYRIQRALTADGWKVRRGSGARMNVALHLADGSIRYVDIFTAHWTEGVLYIPQDTGFRLPKETVLPLTTVELLGRTLPAPRDYETLLAATYGPGWRTPDPSFRYDTPRWLSRRIGGWFGGLRTHRKQWDTFYASHRAALTGKASRFARWVAHNYQSDRLIVDIGAGNARDSRFFARRYGRPVLALDYSVGVMMRAARRTLDEFDIRFEEINLYDAREVLALGTRLAAREEPADLFARFAMHALEPLGQQNLLRLASMTLRRGGYLFLEFRTLEDRGLPKHFGEANRRYVDPAAVIDAIRDRGGRIVHQSTGYGLAPFGIEDPHVCRLVATWAETEVPTPKPPGRKPLPPQETAPEPPADSDQSGIG